jgi:hypothetical protein
MVKSLIQFSDAISEMTEYDTDPRTALYSEMPLNAIKGVDMDHNRAAVPYGPVDR